jgi:hypothetical protein
VEIKKLDSVRLATGEINSSEEGVKREDIHGAIDAGRRAQRNRR